MAGVTEYQISFFKQQRELGLLDLTPTYQRKLVWPDAARAYLIDTILRKLPLPKFFVQSRTDEDGRAYWAVIDGQQRLSAIFDFIGGTLTVPARYSYTGADLGFRDLAPADREAFFSYEVSVHELKGATDPEIRDMFKRLNRNVAKLTNQELRHAEYAGRDFYRFIETLANDRFWVEMNFFPPSVTRRMGDAEFVSELFFALDRGPQHGRASAIDDLYKYYDGNPPGPSARRDFRSLLKLVKALLGPLHGTRYAKTADFYGLFAALADLRREYAFSDVTTAGQALLEFAGKVDNYAAAGETKELPVRRYYPTVIEGPNKFPKRRDRVEILESVLIPLVRPKDPHRLFSEVEKRIIWNSNAARKCAFCDLKVQRWEDYEPDHRERHAAGGWTELANARVAHTWCNRAGRAVKRNVA